MSFARVTKQNPCPVCKKPDWCRVFADGWVECMRVQSDKPAKSGGWMHGLGQLRPLTRPAATLSPSDGAKGRTSPPLNATKLMRDWLAATSATALADFATSLGVSTTSLAAVGAAWAEPHAAWAFPMCDGYGNVIGIRLRNERGKFAVRGSRQGIFLPVASAILPGSRSSRVPLAYPNNHTDRRSDADSGRQDAALYSRQDACHHGFLPPCPARRSPARFAAPPRWREWRLLP